MSTTRLIVPSSHSVRRGRYCSNRLDVSELLVSVHEVLSSAWRGWCHSTGLLQVLNGACLLLPYRDGQGASAVAVVQTCPSSEGKRRRRAKVG